MNYLKQKKINNHGAIEKTVIKGTHEAIVTEEEYYKACEIMQSRRTVIVDKAGEKRRNGTRPRRTVWGKILVCECGNHFNLHTDNRGGMREKNSYQCYSVVNKGSSKTRKAKELSLEDICESQFIPEWKLDFMASQIFKRYIRKY